MAQVLPKVYWINPLWITILCVLSLRAQAQMPERSRQKIEQHYTQALDTSRTSKQRLVSFAKASYAVYKDLSYGLTIAEAFRNYAHQQGQGGYEALALSRIAAVWQTRGNFDKARAIHQESLQIAIDAENKRREADALANLGVLCELEGKLDSALYYHRQSLEVSLQQGIKTFEARAYLNLGTILKLQGQYRESLRNLEKALRICEQVKIKGYYASIYMEMGSVNQLIQEWRLAKGYYTKALQVAEELYNHGKRVEALRHLAEMAAVRNRTDEALVYYRQAYVLATTEQMVVKQVSIRNGLAELFYEQKEYATAWDTVQAALQLVEHHDIGDGADRAYLIAGTIQMAQQQYTSALSLAKQAYTRAQKTQHTSILRPASLLLSQLFEQLNQPAQSLVYYREYHTLKTIADDAEAVKEIMRMELKREYRERAYQDSLQKKLELQELSLQYQEETHQQKLRTYWLWGGISVLVVVLSVGAYFWHQKNRHHQALMEKNQVIEQALYDNQLLLKEVHHRVKNSMQVASSILQLRASNSDSPEAKAALQESQLRLQSIQLAHQKMFEGQNYEQVELIPYLRDLVWMQQQSLLPDACQCQVSGQEVQVSVEQAQALGFVVHEWITNSVKYAWQTEPQTPCIDLRCSLDDTEVHLQYTDNGVGMPEGFVLEEATSFGMKLIRSLVQRQLRGTLQYQNAPGVQFFLAFKRSL